MAKKPVAKKATKKVAAKKVVKKTAAKAPVKPRAPRKPKAPVEAVDVSAIPDDVHVPLNGGLEPADDDFATRDAQVVGVGTVNGKSLTHWDDGTVTELEFAEQEKPKSWIGKIVQWLVS